MSDAPAPPPSALSPLPTPIRSTYRPGPNDRFFAPVVRSWWVVGLLCATILLDLLTIAFESATLAMARHARAGGEVDQDSADLVDLGNGLTAIGSGLVYLTTAVLFCCWLYRAVKNAHLLTEEAGPSPGLAAGSFFIPFYNLWGPIVAVKFAWNASGRLAYAEPEARPRMVIPGVWWATWLIGNVIGNVILRQTIASWGTQPTLDQVILACTANIAMAVANILCAVLCMAVVRRLTGMQRVIERDMNDAATSLPVE